jgi:polyprenyldihydroxybenzoate methyltransferase / 3-demethylubiquinol 3-O-methyltransferase
MRNITRSLQQCRTLNLNRPISTINRAEVSHFDHLASSWWDPNGPSRLLHRMNPLRVQFITSLLPPVSAPTNQPLLNYSVLDIGCGGGILSESLSRLGAQVHGVDASQRAIDAAAAHLRTDPKLSESNPPNYICGSIHNHPTAKLYNLVTAMEVLEHVDYPVDFLDEMARKVKPGGWAVLSTLSRTWLSWLGAVVTAERLIRIVPRGTHSWEKFVNESELRDYYTRLRDSTGHPWAAEVRTRWCGYSPFRGEWEFVDGNGVRAFNYFFAARRHD